MCEIDDHQTQSLSFQEHNPDASNSIVFLHGILASAHEWNSVVPHLTQYHLLVADLPQHGAEGSESSKIPYSHATAVEYIAQLIREHAKEGTAHIVGISLGGCLALSLAAKYPELCLSLFATGCAHRFDQGEGGTNLPAWLICAFLSAANALGAAFSRAIPLSWSLKLCGWQDTSAVTEELLQDIQAATARGISGIIIRGLMSCSGPEVWKKVSESGVRTCVLAGGKLDPIEMTREQGMTLEKASPGNNHKGNNHNKAYVVRDTMRMWNLSHPALFAEGVEAWVAEKDMPVGYEEI
ncbi:uncharacterized protein TRUGW13939_09715 [Talaromyces rugulosus]|uniref:AB hydrolase-1 domain-containing protein n=1 Tax=Talaromyces rugulosus TaxID=121627 RepID=A0A7H8R834_TALRU|nr:uncharacterized protein TRUGW13939_09715 [Talaromyces rugulosus]QKX62554.1 hypothetical protein TRUGW13939_09715 [Talaromyces rugulosus]